MRAPNGDGAVFKISDTWRTTSDGSRVKVKRRKPWVFRITVGYEQNSSNGTWHQKTKVIGTYSTYKEACDARAAYVQGNLDVSDELKFSDAYKRWTDEKSKSVTSKTIDIYDVAYRKCGELYDRDVSTIRLEELQAIIDRDKSPNARKTLRTIFSVIIIQTT